MAIPYEPTNSPGSAVGWKAIVPSDSTVMTQQPRAVWVGTGGDVIAVDIGGNQEAFRNVPSGTRLDIRPAKIMAATTASDLVGMY